jgi:hypothetical protein
MTVAAAQRGPRLVPTAVEHRRGRGRAHLRLIGRPDGSTASPPGAAPPFPPATPTDLNRVPDL